MRGAVVPEVPHLDILSLEGEKGSERKFEHYWARMMVRHGLDRRVICKMDLHPCWIQACSDVFLFRPPSWGSVELLFYVVTICKGFGALKERVSWQGFEDSYVSARVDVHPSANRSLPCRFFRRNGKRALAREHFFLTIRSRTVFCQYLIVTHHVFGVQV